MSDKKDRSDEKAKQEAAAQELQRQIDELISGQTPDRPPRSLRDFINQETLKKQKRRKTDQAKSDKPTP